MAANSLFLECPIEGGPYHYDNRIEKYRQDNKTDTWESCHQRCRNETGCQYWGWINLSYKYEQHRNTCILHRKGEGNTLMNPAVISGGEECGRDRQKSQRDRQIRLQG